LYFPAIAQCLHRLRGEFALIVWDETNRVLFAAYDQILMILASACVLQERFQLAA
jgi:asparagine synthetase B (glutamine-hydrolysing)